MNNAAINTSKDASCTVSATSNACSKLVSILHSPIEGIVWVSLKDLLSSTVMIELFYFLKTTLYDKFSTKEGVKQLLPMCMQELFSPIFTSL